jgi:hypothetical protein
LSTPPVHEHLAPLAFLLGTWRGGGRGDYPTIEGFQYTEEITFGHVGKPFLTYLQKTWNTEGDPLHTEFGYVRPAGEGGVELVLAQPTGVTETHSGVLMGRHIELATVAVGLTPTAKEVTSVRRVLDVDGEVLRYRLDMAAVGREEQFHLEAELHKQ